MANAFLREFDLTQTPAGFTMTYYMLINGTDVPGGVAIEYLDVTIAPGDSPVAIRQRVSDTAVARASQMGLSLAGTNITMPTYQKGM